MVSERDIDKAPDHLVAINTVFDDSETFFIFPTVFGINFFDINKREITQLIGNEESSERFVNIQLYQGKAMRNTSGSSSMIGIGNAASSQVKEVDPT